MKIPNMFTNLLLPIRYSFTPLFHLCSIPAKLIYRAPHKEPSLHISPQKQVFYLILFNFVIACPGYPSSNFLHIKFHIIQDPTLTKPKKILHTIFVPKELGPK